MIINSFIAFTLLLAGFLAGSFTNRHRTHATVNDVAIAVHDTIDEYEAANGINLDHKHHEARALAVTKALTGVQLAQVPYDDLPPEWQALANPAPTKAAA